jgi:hypothetical protein
MGLYCSTIFIGYGPGMDSPPCFLLEFNNSMSAAKEFIRLLGRKGKCFYFPLLWLIPWARVLTYAGLLLPFSPEEALAGLHYTLQVVSLNTEIKVIFFILCEGSSLTFPLLIPNNCSSHSSLWGLPEKVVAWLVGRAYKS